MVIPSSIAGRHLNDAMNGSAKTVLLSGVSIGNLQDFVSAIHKHAKLAIAHIDILGGFKADNTGIELLKNLYKLDGVLTSNVQALVHAKQLGMITVFRLPLLDSLSLSKAMGTLKNTKDYDAVQILPAICAIAEFHRVRRIIIDKPLIASGLIETKEQVKMALSVGYHSVATSHVELW